MVYPCPTRLSYPVSCPIVLPVSYPIVLPLRARAPQTPRAAVLLPLRASDLRQNA